jgi:single-strand DNA-binding protein
MNKVVLVGRLTKDPELKFTNGTGTAVATFTLAVDRKFVDKATGQREADFISIVCWRKTAEFVANYFKKGQMCGVSGAIQTRTYQAQDGSNRYVTEVVADDVEFVGSKKDNNSGFNAGSTKNDSGDGSHKDPMGDGGYVPMDDEDIPF